MLDKFLLDSYIGHYAPTSTEPRALKLTQPEGFV